MKKLLALALCLVMVLSLCACASTPSESTTTPKTDGSEDVGFSTVTPGVLTVATSPDFAPYEFYAIDEDGNHHLAGFDIALAHYIADYLDLELKIVPMDFDGILMELATGNVDLGIAGLSPSPDRMEAMDFSDIYYLGGQSFVTVKGNEDMFPTLESVNNPDFSIGAQTGSIQYALAQEHAADSYIVMLAKVTDIIMELISGKMDGAFIETAVAECYAITYPDLAIVLDVPYENEGSAIGVTKGNAELLAAVNEAVAAALSDGSMDRFIAEANELATGNVFEGLLDG